LNISHAAGELEELHLLEYNRQKLDYLQAWKLRHATQCGMEFFSPNPLRTFSDPYDANKYNDKPISRDMVSEVFQEFVSGTRERESEEYLRTLHQENVILLFLVLFTNSATMYTIWI